MKKFLSVLLVISLCMGIVNVSLAEDEINSDIHLSKYLYKLDIDAEQYESSDLLRAAFTVLMAIEAANAYPEKNDEILMAVSKADVFMAKLGTDGMLIALFILENEILYAGWVDSIIIYNTLNLEDTNKEMVRYALSVSTDFTDVHEFDVEDISEATELLKDVFQQ